MLFWRIKFKQHNIEGQHHQAEVEFITLPVSFVIVLCCAVFTSLIQLRKSYHYSKDILIHENKRIDVYKLSFTHGQQKLKRNTYTMMLLIGMWMSLTKKPMKPIMQKPIAVATAIFWNSGK